ncbi:MAG: glycosyltransferase [Planctomycetes bacterium]|nr:glycosyltransferase [Planctomycetota bacterium]
MPDALLYSVLYFLIFVGSISAIAWLAVYFHPARPWDLRPVGDDSTPPEGPAVWPRVAILVPARNESESLPATLPALLAQDYPGAFRVLLVDDRSADGTAETAERLARENGAAQRLTVLRGQALPDGWAGKVWALEQARRYCESAGEGPPAYFLLTDADIRHAPQSLRRLVAESEAGSLALNSRMARLRCASTAEKGLIPAFLFFFNLLYPMRRVNDPGDPLAAAAGGCVLLKRERLAAVGGFEPIKSAIIDDVSLARTIKAPGAPIRLALSRNEVVSLRAYETLVEIWKMVRRTAFTELKYSWLRLAGALLGLGLMFAVPICWMLAGLGLLAAGLSGSPGLLAILALVLLVKGLFAYALMTLVYRPAVGFYELPRAWAWTLPAAGLLYACMTLDSAVRHLFGLGPGWRDPSSKTAPVT